MSYSERLALNLPDSSASSLGGPQHFFLRRLLLDVDSSLEVGAFVVDGVLRGRVKIQAAVPVEDKPVRRDLAQDNRFAQASVGITTRLASWPPACTTSR